MGKKFSLLKSEIDRLTIFLTIVKMQEEILVSVTEHYKSFLIENVFSRVGLKKEEFPNWIVDLRTGDLVFKENVESKENL